MSKWAALLCLALIPHPVDLRIWVMQAGCRDMDLHSSLKSALLHTIAVVKHQCCWFQMEQSEPMVLQSSKAARACWAIEPRQHWIALIALIALVSESLAAFRVQVAEMAAMAGFSGKVRKPKAAAPKLGKRVSRKVFAVAEPAASELSEPSDDGDDGDEDFGGDEADMDEEVVGAQHPTSGLQPRQTSALG